MKLHYLYVNGFKMFRGCEMSFSDEYAIRFDGVSKVEVRRRDSSVPDCFFTIGAQSEPTVCSVSAVVGENGSGKTSLASFLYNFRRRTFPNETTFVMLYSVGDGERTICAYRLAGSTALMVGGDAVVKAFRFERVPGKTDRIVAHEKDAKIADFALAYYSPVFAPYSPCPSSVAESFVRDLSTTGFLKLAVSQSGINVPFPRNVAYRNYELQDMEQIFRFAAAYNRLPGSMRNVSLPDAQRLEITVDKDSKEAALAALSARIGAKGSLGGNVAFSDIKKATEYDARYGFFFSAFQCFAVVAYLLAAQSSSATPKRWDPGTLLSVLKTSQELLKPKHKGRERRAQVTSVVLDYLRRLSWGRPDHTYERDAYDFFSRLKMLLMDRRVLDLQTGIEAPVMLVKGKKRIPFREALELVRVQHRALGSPFVCFRLRPDMSTGELSYYGLFGRLYDAFVAGMKGRIQKKDVLLFLDEAETSLHPEWQRQLVYNLIWFFESFASGCRVQLVFASHSPVLLSDVPIDNAVFMKRKSSADGCCECEVLRPDRGLFDNTFCANIHDLYAHPFVLRNGFVGKFATEKVNALLRGNGEWNVEQWKKLSAQAKTAERVRRRRIAKLIGDRVIRRIVEKEMSYDED